MISGFDDDCDLSAHAAAYFQAATVPFQALALCGAAVVFTFLDMIWLLVVPIFNGFVFFGRELLKPSRTSRVFALFRFESNKKL